MAYTRSCLLVLQIFACAILCTNAGDLYTLKAVANRGCGAEFLGHQNLCTADTPYKLASAGLKFELQDYGPSGKADHLVGVVATQNSCTRYLNSYNTTDCLDSQSKLTTTSVNSASWILKRANAEYEVPNLYNLALTRTPGDCYRFLSYTTSTDCTKKNVDLSVKKRGTDGKYSTWLLRIADATRNQQKPVVTIGFFTETSWAISILPPEKGERPILYYVNVALQCPIGETCIASSNTFIAPPIGAVYVSNSDVFLGGPVVACQTYKIAVWGVRPIGTHTLVKKITINTMCPLG